jgi:hypothetical protein
MLSFATAERTPGVLPTMSSTCLRTSTARWSDAPLAAPLRRGGASSTRPCDPIRRRYPVTADQPVEEAVEALEELRDRAALGRRHATSFSCLSTISIGFTTGGGGGVRRLGAAGERSCRRDERQRRSRREAAMAPSWMRLQVAHGLDCGPSSSCAPPRFDSNGRLSPTSLSTTLKVHRLCRARLPRFPSRTPQSSCRSKTSPRRRCSGSPCATTLPGPRTRARRARAPRRSS